MMNGELTEYRLNAVENGLAATNENISKFEQVARLQGENIAALMAKTEIQNDTMKKIVHNLKNTDAAVDKFVEGSDIRFSQYKEKFEEKLCNTFEKLDSRMAVLEQAHFQKKGSNNMLHLLIDKFPSIVSLLIFIIVIVNSFELDKFLKLVGK